MKQVFRSSLNMIYEEYLAYKERQEGRHGENARKR